jgi:hypothetical protein
LDIRNAHPDHIGVLTIDVNVSHTRWPCVAHPANLECEEAVRLAARRPLRTLVPAQRVPTREWVDKR